ncbi:MAG TPA: NUDIX domain-containing protein [Stellaceae bacterium]|nr:NUDIX domain-containing protein [Stellaceae bacterium]
MAERRPAAPAPSHPDVEIAGVESTQLRYLRLDSFRFRHRLFSGGWSTARHYEVVRRGEAVAVILYDPARDCVVLVEQFRLPGLLAGRSPWQIEAVAGLIDGDGESAEEVALRETQEEAGLAPLGGLIPIQRYLPSVGASDECVHLFCGRVDAADAGGVHGLADEHEDIRVVVKSMPEIETLLDAGMIESGHTLVALYWLLRHREALRRRWGG